MRDSTEVIAHVVEGHGPKLAKALEVSLSRCYEILSTDNPYPKSKRLIRKIAEVNRPGVRLIKADMDALFDELLGETQPCCAADLHKEAFEAVQASLEGKPKAEQMKELRELISAASAMLQDLDNGGNGRG
jgi:uncharacterized protein with ATP-grasp and redox domains